jgi:uncharacterized membrane protein
MTGRWARPTRPTIIAACLAIGVSLLTAVYLAVIYPTLPFGLPVRFERGEPLIYDRKSPVLVFLPVIVEAGLLLVFGSLAMLLLWRARPAGENTTTGGDEVRMRLAAEGVALLAALWICVQAIGAARLILLWQRGSGGFGIVYNAALITSIVLSIVIVARTMKLVGNQRQHPVTTDPALWRLRHLYFNPGDPALFVPTRYGAGWTLNFGRPLAIVMLAAALGVGIGGPFYVARMVLRGFWR